MVVVVDSYILKLENAGGWVKNHLGKFPNLYSYSQKHSVDCSFGKSADGPETKYQENRKYGTTVIFFAPNFTQ
jgi:hypothetical protein